jgi:hypothetical protein
MLLYIAIRCLNILDLAHREKLPRKSSVILGYKIVKTRAIKGYRELRRK